MKYIDNERGVILMVTLAIMAILVVVVLEFNYQMLVQFDFTSAYTDDMKAYYLAKSGVHTAIALLMEDILKEKDDYDGLDEPWAQINQKPLILEDGTASVTVTDEGGKLNINYFYANKDLKKKSVDIKNFDGTGIFRRLLEFRDVPDEDIDGLIDSVMDWLDLDDKARIEGAEEAYYNSLDIPVNIKNGLIDTISEVSRIKNFSKDILSKLGASSNLYGDIDPSLLDYLTANSDGLININTADIILIQSLSDIISIDDAQDIIREREDEPYKDINEVQSDAALANDKWNSIKNKITVKSDYYSIVSVGNVSANSSDKYSGSIKRAVKAIVKRDRKKSKINILYWKTE